MSTILVTGGAGFIGSHTCKALSAAGLQPVVIDNLSTGFRHNVKWGPLIEGDVGDRTLLNQIFLEYPVAGVIHFAASTYVGESMSVPLQYYRNNVAATLNLLEAITAHGSPPLIFSSSCATYGIPVGPLAEDHPQNPVNPYGWSKLMCERLILDTAMAHGLRAAILRYFNAAGADPDGELREEHDPETHLIPLAVGAALGTRPPLKVFGTDYPTPDGTCIRDYIHVSDLASAHVRALGELQGGSPGFIRNLGTGRGHSVAQVLEAIAAVTGRPVAHELHPRRPGDPPALTAPVSEEVSAGLRFPGLSAIINSVTGRLHDA